MTTAPPVAPATATVTATATIHRWTPVSRTASGALSALLLALAFAPFVFTPEATAKLTTLFVLVIVAAMWNALAGYAGLVSVGQQGFIGLGAYGVFLFVDRGVTPFSRSSWRPCSRVPSPYPPRCSRSGSPVDSSPSVCGRSRSSSGWSS